jgi:hypothetical protein
MRQHIVEITVNAQNERDAWIKVRQFARQKGYDPDLIPNGFTDLTAIDKKQNLRLTGFFQQSSKQILRIDAFIDSNSDKILNQPINIKK